MKSDVLHKGLLPYRGKAILSHVIDQLPGSKFILAVHHHADQLREYLRLAHPEEWFEFVDVGSVDAPGAGPGKSLLLALEETYGPALVVTSDTYFELPKLVRWDRNWLGAGAVAASEQLSYCNLRTDEFGEVVEVRDKSPADDSFVAWTGLMYLKDWESARDNLRRAQVACELQCSAAWRDLRFWVVEHRWLDFGTKERYDAAALTEGYDYSKPDEQTYLVGQRVVKFFADKKRVEARLKRWHLLNKETVPTGIISEGRFISYELVPGRTFYEAGDPYKFKLLLSWLERKLWNVRYLEGQRAELCHQFYYGKTKARTEDYLLHSRHDVTSVNGQPVELSWPELLDRVNWDKLTDGTFTTFHGDLQFDNIIVQPNGGFKLIDWRDDFAGHSYGDLRYDLAKLLSGATFDFDLVKRFLFSVTFQGTSAYVSFPRRTFDEDYERLLREHHSAHGYDWKATDLLRWLIIAGMSGLHKEPYAEALYLFSLAGALQRYHDPAYADYFKIGSPEIK